MAGTDRRQTAATAASASAPIIILIKPQLGENIGMVARAMLNCGLTRLRLVRPRDGWPNDRAAAAASGADIVLKEAEIFETGAEAVADLVKVYAASTRHRDMTMPVLTPQAVAAELRDAGAVASGIIFGGEAMGLDNDDISLADAILRVPLSSGFSSLNLAQAVLIAAYEWFKLADDTPASELPMAATRPANKAELEGFLGHLEKELEAGGFYHIAEKKPIMARNLRNIFQRAALTEQEVRTLRGVISSLTRKRI